MRAEEFVTESDEPTRIKLGSSDPAARAWINRIYKLYPQTFQNNHVMPLGSAGDDQEFAMFELVPSLSRRGAVEVKWFQAYPLRQGVGSRAMQQLQQLAREDNISLTLFPWDKGQVSQSKLTKFYKSQGFAPIARGGKSMSWTPEQSGVSESWGVSKQPIPLPIGDYLAVGSDEFAPPGNYRSAEDLHDEVYSLIDAGVDPQVVNIDPRTVLATQDWLSNAGGDDPLFDEYPDRPVIYSKAGKLYILDGHHRTTRAWKAGRPIGVYMFSDQQQQNLDEDIYDVLQPLDCGPFDGGCVLVAQALQQIHGGRVVVLVDADDRAQHAAVLADGQLIDYDGAAEPKEFVQRFEQNERANIQGIRPIRDTDLPDAPRDAKLIPQIVQALSENFADGKNPGRKGLSKRVGIPKKASLSQLQKIASSSTGERRRMAQWQLNMRRGKAKKKK